MYTNYQNGQGRRTNSWNHGSDKSQMQKIVGYVRGWHVASQAPSWHAHQTPTRMIYGRFPSPSPSFGTRNESLVDPPTSDLLRTVGWMLYNVPRFHISPTFSPLPCRFVIVCFLFYVYSPLSGSSTHQYPHICEMS